MKVSDLDLKLARWTRRAMGTINGAGTAGTSAGDYDPTWALKQNGVTGAMGPPGIMGSPGPGSVPLVLPDCPWCQVPVLGSYKIDGGLGVKYQCLICGNKVEIGQDTLDSLMNGYAPLYGGMNTITQQLWTQWREAATEPKAYDKLTQAINIRRER